MSTAAQLVITSFPDEITAKRIADGLVEKRLAACVSLVPGAQSVYLWEGKVRHESEWLGFIKTSAECFFDLEKQLLEWHPYEMPEIIAISIAAGSNDYLSWLLSHCRPGGGTP